QGDAGEFFKFIAHEEDRRRVCGFPAIYTMLQTLSLEHGQLLNYDQSFEKMTNSLVTFCAVKFS
ncbi:MAG: hypothetical protein JO317_02410, partial [Verrucomicrobiae bacterium]|nr:hypothetical protein [Verrucomicrobiae bacterium]